jgi:hypothetical protein
MTDEKTQALANTIRKVLDSGEMPEVTPELLAAVTAALGEQDAATGLLRDVLLARGRAAVLQKQAADLLDGADRTEYTLAVTEKAQAAGEKLVEAETSAEELAELARVALGAERHAADKATEAAEFYRECRDAAEEAALIGDTPEVQTDLLVRAEKAQVVLNDFAAAADRASLGRVDAEAARDSMRELVKVRKAEKADADAVVAAAPDAELPMSEFTVLFDGLRRVFAGVPMTGAEREALQGQARELADFTGVSGIIRKEERKRIEDEQYRQVTSRMLPAQGHALRPQSSVIPAPVR